MKRIFALILTLMICATCSIPAYADGNGGHWADMRLVLFGTKDFIGSGEVQKSRQILEQAVSLCVDQYQGSGVSYLNSLKEKKVPNLPNDISEIDLCAGSTDHREYTHCGWSTAYKSNSVNPDWAEKRWPSRQKILRSSVEHVFRFDGLRDKNEQIEAFCVLLYCIHILGDHKVYTKNSYKSHKGKIIPLAGVDGEMTIISDLLKCFSALFVGQDYSELERKLDAQNIEIRNLIYNEKRLETDEGFKQYNEYANKILETLSIHVPNLLQNTQFFIKAFP